MSQHDNSSSDFEDDSELLRNAVDEDSQQDEGLLEDEPEVQQRRGVEQGEEASEEEGSCEMLDLLCDQVEVEEYKEEKKRELEQMKKIMDDRQQRREQIKEKKEAQRLEQEANECEETYSQILMREGSRKIKQDQLQAKLARRKYIQFDELDSKEQLAPTGTVATGKGFFTVGVIVDKSRVLESAKTGKKFIILKLSDLVKYDMGKVRQKVSQEFKNDGAAQK